MTLDIPKFIQNIIEKQMKIQHFDATVKVYKKDLIPTSIVEKIKSQFGEEYLGDSQYVIFYKGNIDKKKLKKMFNMTDKALGENANRLTEGDFKQLKMSDDEEIISTSDDASQIDSQDQGKQDDSLSDVKIDDDKDEEEVSDVDDKEEPVDDEDKDEKNDIEDDVDETSDDEKKLDEDEDEESSIPFRFFFLKITTRN